MLLPDATALDDTAEMLRLAEQSGDDLALALARSARGITLIHHGGHDRDTGLDLLVTAVEHEGALQQGFSSTLPILEFYIARERARLGEVDDAIGLAGRAVDLLITTGGIMRSLPATDVLVELLLRRGSARDLADAAATVERLADVTAERGLVLRDVWLLRLRARLARAHGDDSTYRELRERYRGMATDLGFEGHAAMAEEL